MELHHTCLHRGDERINTSDCEALKYCHNWGPYKYLRWSWDVALELLLPCAARVQISLPGHTAILTSFPKYSWESDGWMDGMTWSGTAGLEVFVSGLLLSTQCYCTL